MAIYSPVSDKSQLGEPIVPVDHGGLIAGLIVSILLIVIVIAALFYYRRRISHLKSELAHVQYIADPSSAPGTSPLAQVAPLFSDGFLRGKVWSLAVVGRSESKKRETLFFFLCLIMGRSSSFRQSSVLLSYGRSYGIRCRRRFEQHSHPQRPWLRRQQEQLDQFGTGEIGSQRSRRRLFWRLGLLSSANHNLFFFKNNKIFWIKGAYGGSVSSTAELYKNREADMANPNLHNFNIYHTIDEEKVSKSVEHLYDEIKHKNKDYGEFFFLLLSRSAVTISLFSFTLTGICRYQSAGKFVVHFFFVWTTGNWFPFCCCFFFF